jgi:glycogen synthase
MIATGGRPLRVLFLSREYPPETGGGGIGTYVETMARALVARGHEVHVLSCVPGQKSEDQIREGVHLHRRGVWRVLPKMKRWIPATGRRIEGAISCYAEFRRLALDVDVVEAPDWMGEGLAFALSRARPLVGHLHTPLLLVGQNNPGSFRWTRDRRAASIIEQLAIRRADVVTSPSKLLVERLAEAGWLRPDGAAVIRYPADVEMWAGLPPVESSPPRVLTVGRLEELKAPEVLVRAASLLAPYVDELEVVFIGRSGLRNGCSYRDWLMDLSSRLRAPCRFVDQTPRSELRTWYGSSRVVALCSRHDNFPFVGLEGMCAGRPLVCTSAMGTAELLDGSSAGAVVPVEDAEALAEALLPYLLDADVAGAAGRTARALVTRHCAPERIAERREACYHEALRRWQQRKRGLPTD